jgi:uroporphyrin-III C-methyltransferase
VFAEAALDGAQADGGGMSSGSVTLACTGSVTLVGAGPGDPELLTVKAIKAIRQATVLLVDDLVSDAVLRYARKTTRVVHVGKRGGGMCAPRPLRAAVAPQGELPGLGRPGARPCTPQAFIEKLMIAEAQRGQRVVRLKGGDPFVFGRGGEELEHLQAAGVQVSVVNGITSGLAAATSLGVPWTHREHAHGVMLITGHAKEGGAAPHWPTLGAAAAQGVTLVIYMGVAQLEAIARGLADALPPHTPAALVQSASTANERRWVSTLALVARDAQAHGFGSPAILIIGDVLQGLQAAAPRQSDASFTPLLKIG